MYRELKPRLCFSQASHEFAARWNTDKARRRLRPLFGIGASKSRSEPVSGEQKTRLQYQRRGASTGAGFRRALSPKARLNTAAAGTRPPCVKDGFPCAVAWQSAATPDPRVVCARASVAPCGVSDDARPSRRTCAARLRSFQASRREPRPVAFREASASAAPDAVGAFQQRRTSEEIRRHSSHRPRH